MICDMCKKEFDPEQCKPSCEECHLASSCQGIRCPYCFYQMVPAAPSWYARLKSFFQNKQNHREQKPEKDIVCLSDFGVNCPAKIVRIEPRDHHQLQKMSAMGVLPGSEIVLIRKKPVYVLETGFSRFSFDEELASVIFLQRKQESTTSSDDKRK